MSKNFSKTMTFESFKEIAAKTPEMKVNAFLNASREQEKASDKVKEHRGELLQLFSKKENRFLYVYENLSTFKDFTPSEVVKIMKNAAFWEINKVPYENSVEIVFTDSINFFKTNPIKVNDFINFLNE